MSFANSFKEARNKIGMSQEELAGKLHISRQAISRYENGTAEPSIDMLNDICVVLDISLDALVGSKKEVPEYKQFDSLSKGDKIMLWHDFVVLSKRHVYFLPFIYFMCMNIGIGTTAYGFIRIINANLLSTRRRSPSKFNGNIYC